MIDPSRLADLTWQKEESSALRRLAASMLEQPFAHLLREIESEKALAKKQRDADA